MEYSTSFEDFRPLFWYKTSFHVIFRLNFSEYFNKAMVEILVVIDRNVKIYPFPRPMRCSKRLSTNFYKTIMIIFLRPMVQPYSKLHLS